MGREIIFHPETERSRDLLYTEYTSCDRSVHVLVQDNGVEHYRFLLDAYRDIVAHYLSFDPIEPPISFLRHVATQIEAHAESSAFPMEDFQTIGIYVLLRASDAYYLLVSRQDHTYLHEHDRFRPLPDVTRGVDEIQLVDRDAQEELFPQHVTDRMTLYRINPHRLEGCDLVMGCGEEDRGAVFETLNDPMGIPTSGDGARAIKRAVSSRFITRKVMAVGIDAEGMAASPETARPDRLRSGRLSKRLTLVVGAVVVALGAGLWAWSAWIPGLDEQHTASQQSPVIATEADATAVQEVSAGSFDPNSVGDERDLANTATAVGTPPALENSWALDFSSPVTSSPAIYDGAVVFGCRDSSVYAVEQATGETRWRYRTTDGVGASPAMLGTSVIGADYKGNVFSLDARTGDRLWKRRLPAKIVSSPCVAGNRVLVGCYDGNVYCLDGASGNVIWKRACGGRVRANVATDQLRFFVPSYDGKLYALSGETGRQMWAYTVGGNLSGGAVHSSGTVYVGGPDGRLHAVDADTGKPDWAVKLGGALKSSVAVGGGRVYVGSNDRHVYCVNADDGAMLWKFQTGGIVLSAPRLRDGALFVGSYDGVLYCLDGLTGELLARVDSAGEIYSSPVVYDDNVYFGNNNGRFLHVVYRHDPSP